MNASRRPSRRRADAAAVVAVSALFVVACNLLVSVPDPIPIATSDASMPPDASVASDAGDASDAAHAADASDAAHASDASDASDAADAADASDASDASDTAPACDPTADDDQNCGWCGHSCGGAPCQSGLCVPSALATSGPEYLGIYAVLIAQGELYFTNWGGTSPMYRLDLATSGVASFDSGYGATLSRLGNTIFYGKVYSVPGGDATDVYAFDIDAGPPALLLKGAPDILWVMKEDAAHIFYSLESGGLFRTAMPSGTSGTPDGGFLADELITDPKAEFDLLGNTIYIAVSGRVSSLPTLADAGTPPVPLYAFGEPRGIATDGSDSSDLYWYDATAQTINRGTVDGKSSTVLATLPSAPQGIAVDAVSVYIEVGPSIMAVDKDGTRLRTYARWEETSTQDVATAVAFDDGYVYWGRNIGAPSTLSRVAK